MAKKTEVTSQVLGTAVHLYDADHPAEVFPAGMSAAELPEWAVALLGEDHPVWGEPAEGPADGEPSVSISVE